MDNSSPSSLATPHRSFQSHQTSLSNLPTNPTQIHQQSSQSHREHHSAVLPFQVVNNSIGSTHEYNSSTYPSLLQQDALAFLQHLDNQVVLAWLTGLRSFKAGGNHWFQPRSLSSQQLEAVSLLQGCPDDLVTAWLDFTRAGG